MTTEFNLLLALFGAGILLMGRKGHDRGPEHGGEWARPPSWLRVLARPGPGPLRIMDLAFEIYGAGLMVLALAVVAVGTNATFLIVCLAAWLGGGIPVLGATDAVLSIQGWRRRRARRDQV